MSNPEQRRQMPIEITLDELKVSVAQYANGLVQAYGIPSTFMIYILQEIVNESKLAVYERAMAELRAKDIETEEMEIDLDDLEE